MKKTADQDSAPQISVIMPVYNTEEFMEESLASLLAQTFQDYELIMVDDESTDASGKIADLYAGRYENFSAYHVPNGGPGRARNFGISKARGKYLAFMDSDDLLLPGTYETMYRLAEHDGSDLTICNARRCNSTKRWNASLYVTVFQDAASISHIRKNYHFLYDTTSWNKLIRRDYWERHGFLYPEKIYYQDIPVMVPVHYHANQVSVVRSYGYLWRERDFTSRSITQHKRTLRNLQDRFTSMGLLDRFFEEEVTEPELFFEKNRKYLTVDLMIFVDSLTTLPEEEAYQMLDLIRGHLEEAGYGEDLYASIPVIDQVKYQCVSRRDLAGLKNAVKLQQESYSRLPVTEEDGRFYIDIVSGETRLPHQDITRELTSLLPQTGIKEILCTEEKIEIHGFCLIPRVNISSPEEQEVNACLCNEFTGNRLGLVVKAIQDPELTKEKGTVIDPVSGKSCSYCYDGCSFCILIHPGELAAESLKGSNLIELEVTNRTARKRVILRGIPDALKNQKKGFALLTQNLQARLDFLEGDLFSLHIEEVRNTLKDCQQRTSPFEALCLSLDAPAQKMTARPEQRGLTDITLDRVNDTSFSLPLQEISPGTEYLLYVCDGENESPLFGRRKELLFFSGSGKTWIVRSNADQMVRIALQDQITLVSDRIQSFGTLKAQFKIHTLTPGLPTAPVSCQLCVFDPRTWKDLVLARCAPDPEGGNECIRSAFQLDFEDKDILSNLYESYRELYVRYLGPDGELISRQPLYSKDYFSSLVEFPTLQLRLYRHGAGFMRLYIRKLWASAENTREKREFLYRQNYPKYQELPLDERLILFESSKGSSCSGNPLALYQYIDSHLPDFQCVWSLTDPRSPIPGKGRRIRRASQGYYKILATAKYIFTDSEVLEGFSKRTGQILVQTLHGMPVRKLGLDLLRYNPDASGDDFLSLQKQYRDWDYLIVQSRFMAHQASSCFGRDIPMLKWGEPRTDFYFGDKVGQKEALRQKFGFPNGKKILIYVPATRIKGKWNSDLDLCLLKQMLGKEYIILLCPEDGGGRPSLEPYLEGFAYDFSQYQCREELFLLSDILITDYSASVFDFCLMNKPVIFYGFDAAFFVERYGGLYFDPEKQLPGPHTYSTRELAETISSLPAFSRRQFASLIKEFASYEISASSDKIIKRIIKKRKGLFHKDFFKRK
ncbi:MAG: CDP-glycerol glycerophosphotransferase family protein [Blautia sp.]|nr:CDP-glycerol glycerophosphotransferase family protein [Blautia sp.]